MRRVVIILTLLLVVPGLVGAEPLRHSWFKPDYSERPGIPQYVLLFWEWQYGVTLLSNPPQSQPGHWYLRAETYESVAEAVERLDDCGSWCASKLAGMWRLDDSTKVDLVMDTFHRVEPEHVEEYEWEEHKWRVR